MVSFIFFVQDSISCVHSFPSDEIMLFWTQYMLDNAGCCTVPGVYLQTFQLVMYIVATDFYAV